jgi:cytochrome c2
VRLAVILVGSALIAGPALGQDAGRGRLLFEDCRSCHSLDPTEKGLPGPHLKGLSGRRVGSAAGFDYSPALTEAGRQGATWDAARLTAFLADPEAMFPGLWMSPPGRMSEADRRALAAFLMRNGRDAHDPPPQVTRGSPQRPLVRARRHALLGPPLALDADGLRPGRLGRQADDRHPQHLVGRIKPCHAHFKDRVEDVKRGILQAGGFPIELPALSLSESNVKPTTMLYRNMLAMEAEELIRSHSVDGAVLMGGCDKTTPALLMGATSAGPADDLSAGRSHAARQLEGQGAGLRLGCLEVLGRAAGRQHLRPRLVGRRGRHRPLLRRLHDHGHRLDHDGHRRCAIGMTLPGASAIPAADANHKRMCAAVGRRIVEMVWEDLTPTEDPDPRSLPQRHQCRHGDGLLDQRGHPRHRHGAAGRHRYLARRFRRRAAWCRSSPMCGPSGDTYLMEDFYLCGRPAGADDSPHRPSASRRRSPSRARRWADNLVGAEVHNDDVIRTVRTRSMRRARSRC